MGLRWWQAQRRWISSSGGSTTTRLGTWWFDDNNAGHEGSQCWVQRRLSTGWLDGFLAAVVQSSVRDRRREMKIEKSRIEIEKERDCKIIWLGEKRVKLEGETINILQN